MFYLKNRSDLKNLNGVTNIPKEMAYLVSKDYGEFILEIEGFGVGYLPEKYGIGLIIEKGELIETLNHFGIDILNKTIPDFVCEVDKQVIKASVQLLPSYYLQIYFYKGEQPFLFEWCLKNQSFYRFSY